MKTFSMLALAFSGAVLFSPTVQAGDKVLTADNPTWRAECTTCHLAYPPQLLDAESWRALMAGLNRHFGVDASVDTKSAAAIGDFLERHAGNRRKYADGRPVLRISETRWFRREHDEVAASVWSRPTIKSAANCAACHREAERGDYAERNIRIPK